MWQQKHLAVLTGGCRGALRWIWRRDGGDFVARFDEKKKGIQAGVLAEISYFVEGALAGNTDFVGRDLADKMDFVAKFFLFDLFCPTNSGRKLLFLLRRVGLAGNGIVGGDCPNQML